MKILKPSLLVIFCFVLGGMIFKFTSPHGCGTILQDDSIFVLTGDANRIPFAVSQLDKYPHTDLYIIGAGVSGVKTDSGNVTVESDSKSTYQNAIAIHNIVNAKGMNRFVLITSEDHMRRALYLVRQELPNIEISVCSVPLNGVTPSRRLQRWTTEYIKYIVTLFGIKES